MKRRKFLILPELIALVMLILIAGSWTTAQHGLCAGVFNNTAPSISIFSVSPESGKGYFNVTLYGYVQDIDGDLDMCILDFGDGFVEPFACRGGTFGFNQTRVYVKNANDPLFTVFKPKFEVVDLGGLRATRETQILACFIATAAYGSAMHEDVDTLRDFRDQHLITNSLGGKFVELYYRYSPPAAEFISDKPALRAVMRFLLKPLVWLSEKVTK